MSNKVVFITGGNSGIGLATAVKFAKSGCDVSIFSRREDANASAKSQLEALGVKCVTFAGDVTNEADLAAAVDKTCSELGRLDYAFNNAGVEQVPSSLTDQTDDDYRRIIDINVKGVWLSMQQEIPRMLESGGGAIVNTGSVASLIGMSNIPLYIASKHAVLGLTRSVALEFAQQKIRINAVCPAAVKTDLYDRFTGKNPEMEQAIENMHPMGRSGTPDEIASAVYWLCTEATWTTGQAITIDGGFTAQ